MNALLPSVQQYTQQHLATSEWLDAATKEVREMSTPSSFMNKLCDDITCSCHDEPSSERWTFVPPPPGKRVETFFGTSSVVTRHDNDTLLDRPDATLSPLQIPSTWLEPHSLVLAEVTKMKDQKWNQGVTSVY